MKLLIMYDIETSGFGNIRLRNAMKLCTQWGTRVQNSVYECDVNAAQYRELKMQLESILDKETDSVRLYPLGNHYHALEILGKKDPASQVEKFIL